MKSIVCSTLLCAAILPLCAAPGNMIGRQTQNEGITAVPVRQPVVIDGNLDEWDLSGRIWSYMDTSIRDAFSVKTAAMWDKDNLYLSFQWSDPYPLVNRYNPDFDPSRGWMADALQLRVVAGKQTSWLTSWCYDGKMPVLHIAYWESETKPGVVTQQLRKAAPGSVELGDGIRSAYRVMPDGKGFIHEMQLPWKTLFRDNRPLAAGDKIQMGMEFLWGQSSGTGWPIHRYADNMAVGATSREFYWTARNAWGDLALSASPVKQPREYVETIEKPAGTVPVRAVIPADAKTFTLVIEDTNGKRIRNLAGGFTPAEYTVARSGKSATVEVNWDALDDDGNLVKPGAYRVRGLTQQGIEGRYSMCFYSPGVPAWKNTDTRSAWMADHNPPETIARSGDRIIVSCQFAEGGSGTIAVDKAGNKQWGEVKGTSVIAANDRYIFTVPNDWGVRGGGLLRMESATGKFAPFLRDGKALPLPRPFPELIGVEPSGRDKSGTLIFPKAIAMSLHGNDLILVMDNGKAYRIDAEKGLLRHTFDLPLEPTAQSELQQTGRYPFAFDGKSLYFFRQRELIRRALDTGAETVVPLRNDGWFSFLSCYRPGEAVEMPSAMTIGADGNLYIADLGSDLQVKKFSPDGKMLARIGKRGGRARMGQYDPAGMREMSSIAVDGDHRLWVTEYSHLPRRISVWNPDGSLHAEHLGNSGYAGQGTTAHDNDPTRVYAEGNEITIDPATGKWQVANVMWNPDPKLGEFILPGSSAGGDGHIFYSAASGKKCEYYASLGDFRSTPYAVLMKRNDRWQPVSAITRVANLQKLLGGQHNAQIINPATGKFADCDPADVLIWNDLDNDGYVQRNECEIIPAVSKTKLPGADGKNGRNGISGIPIDAFGWGQRVNPDDFSFFSSLNAKRGKLESGIYRFRPDRFTADGAPVYSSRSWQRIADGNATLMEAVPVPGTDNVLTFRQEGNRKYVAGMSAADGSVRWRYPSPYHQVHGSHKATMPKPGLLIGCLKITGVIPGCGEAGDVFMIRGNLGQDYYLTSDGLYIDTMFQDCRLPVLPLPESEAALRQIPMGIFSGGGEHFCGWIGRHDDGRVRMTCGLAREAGMVVTIDGLDSVRRFAAPAVTVTDAMLVAADRDNTRRALAAAKPAEPYTIAAVTGKPDWNRIKGIRIHKEGQNAVADFKAAYDAKTLYLRFNVTDPSPWKNGGKDAKLLFKTGDCVEFQLSPSGNRGHRPADGDLRLIFAPFEGKPSALLMKPVAANAAKEEKHTYSSPVSTFVFDQVKLLPDLRPEVKVSGNGYLVTAAVPWQLLGVAPKPGMTLRGDAGFILSDAVGAVNTARIYRYNANTNLVNDIPHEAMIVPAAWGEFILGK